MKRSGKFAILASTILFTGLSAGLAQEPRLIIRSGFEADTYLEIGLPENHIRGVDQSVAGPYNTWSPLRDKIGFELWNHETYPDKAYYELIADPLDSTNRVLLAELRGHNGLKGRAQGSFKFTYGTSYPTNVIHFRFRWLIPSDWESLGEMDPHGWTDFFEIWTKYGNEADFDVYDPAGTFRTNFRFEESGGRFIWHIKGEDRCYKGTNDREWVRYNREIPVPFGRWAEFEVLLVKGPDPKAEPRSQARFLVKIKTGDDPWQVLFDVRDERTEHSYAPQPGYRSFQPVKNYTQANNIDYLIGKGLKPAFYYDDFELSLSDTHLPPAYRHHLVPGRVEAEWFSDSEGTTTRETTDTEGAQDVDSIGPGDWLEFQVNTPDGRLYPLNCRVLPEPSGASFSVFRGDSLLGRIDIPAVERPEWLNLCDTLAMIPGNQTLRFVTDTGRWAFNWFSLEQLPLPTVLVTPLSDTICSGGSTGFLLESGVEMAHGVAFHFTAVGSTGNLGGHGSGVLAPGEVISQILTNAGDRHGTVNYEVVPYALTESGTPSYPGEAVTAKVWVEPVPVLTTFSMKDTIDSSESTLLCHRVSAITTAGVLTTYESGTSGHQVTGNGSGVLLDEQCITEELINSAASREYVVYTQIPYALDGEGNLKCPGYPSLATPYGSGHR